MYTPDKRIVKYLKEIDPDLSARYDMEVGLFAVTWQGKDCFHVHEPDGTFRVLDERVLTQVRYNAAREQKDSREIVRLMKDERHRISESGRARMADDFRQFVVEEGYQKVFGCGQFKGWSPPSEARA